jgi:hypothetical protein
MLNLTCRFDGKRRTELATGAILTHSAHRTIVIYCLLSRASHFVAISLVTSQAGLRVG